MVVDTLSRPYITYATNVVSQFMHTLTSIHLTVVERIVLLVEKPWKMSYLKKNPGRGFIYTKGRTLSVEACIDVDWVGSIDDKKSISTYCIYLGGNLVV